MRTFSTSDLSRKSGDIIASALQGPVSISQRGNPAGPYWTAAQPAGPLQSVTDSALDQSWGNSATTTVTRSFPAGTQYIAARQPRWVASSAGEVRFIFQG
jgi:hypothetical protein